jgi:hypothetical protein
LGSFLLVFFFFTRIALAKNFAKNSCQRFEKINIILINVKTLKWHLMQLSYVNMYLYERYWRIHKIHFLQNMLILLF